MLDVVERERGGFNFILCLWVLEMGSSGYFTHLEIPGLGILPLKGRVRAVELMLLKKDEASLECWS